VLLGFAAVTVWEAYDKARASVQQEADDLADLYRDAQTFPDETRTQIEDQIREYVRLVVEKEWPAMAERNSISEPFEVWDAYTRLWRTYYQFQPGSDQQRIWYARSITKLNDLSDQRRLRLQSSRAGGVPTMMWVALLGAGAITIAFSFLFGTQSAAAQVVISSGLAFTIALVMLAIIALEQPFAGISRIGPQTFVQLERVFEQLDAARSRGEQAGER
jgi:hypothetical protein